MKPTLATERAGSISFHPSKQILARSEKVTGTDNLSNCNEVICNSQPSTIRILLVEDNLGDARLVREMLAEAGVNKFNLTHVERLSEALQHLNESNFDAILLDLSLPDGHGLNTVKRMRSVAPNVPIIVFTGSDDEALAVQAVREGAQDYLVKGQMDGNLLMRAMRYAIERHQLLVDLEQRTQELQIREANFRNVIATNVDSMIIVGRDGVVQFINPATVALFGCTAEELLGELFGFPVVAGETREFCIIRKGRESAVVEMRVTETNWEGESTYLASIRDITERQRAEEILRLNDRAMAATSNGIVITDASQPENPIIYCNPAFERITGYSQDEILGHNCRFLQGPETDPAVVEQIRHALRQKQECRVILKNYRKNGTPFWNELAISPVKDASDQLTHFIGVQTDITERKRTEEALLRAKVAEAARLALETEITERKRVEEALRESERKLSTLIDSLPGIVFSCNTDPELSMKYLSEGCLTLTGYTSQELIGNRRSSYNSIIHAEDLAKVFQAIKTAIAQKQPYVVEYRIHTKSGQEKWLWEKGSGVFNKGELLDLEGFITDITERKRAEEEMRNALEKEKELNELKSRFVTMTSHEFRTPLSTILSSAEIIQKYGYKLTDEKKLQHLQRIQIIVKNMTQLLNDVLLIGKAEAGRLEFKPTPLELVELCCALVEEIQISTITHTITFVSQGECTTACMDEKLLRHILSNLLSNAIKYSPHSSTVRFVLVCDQEEAIFQIQDEGIGIPPADQAQLFSSFHRASNVGTISGTGLGLAIVKKSVDLHGGKISVKSEVGAGTTFIVTIPLNNQIATDEKDPSH